MAGNFVDIFLLSLLAMLNPTLLAAVTVMLLLPNPGRLMLGYLLGAYTASFALGLAIVFSLNGSAPVHTTRHRISPAVDLVLGLLAITLAWVLRTGRDEPLQVRRRRRKDAKLEARRKAGKPTESLPLRMLGKGDPRITFVVGALLSLPGVAYLEALDHVHRLRAGTLATVLLVVFICLIQQLLLEVPLLGYVFDPERTQSSVARFRAWMSRRGRSAAVIGASAIGVALLARGVPTLL